MALATKQAQSRHSSNLFKSLPDQKPLPSIYDNSDERLVLVSRLSPLQPAVAQLKASTLACHAWLDSHMTGWKQTSIATERSIARKCSIMFCRLRFPVTLKATGHFHKYQVPQEPLTPAIM